MAWLREATGASSGTGGGRLASIAHAVRGALPDDGATTLLGGVRTAARRGLGAHDGLTAGADLGTMIERYPVQAMLLGAGVGFALYQLAKAGRPAVARMAPGGRRCVGHVMTRHVEVIRPDTTLREAAAKMADLDVGTMPVCDGERLVGMLTDRDITIRAVARGLDPSATPARDVMSTAIRYTYEDEPLEDARAAMKRGNVRRLPVLDRGKRLVGIVALGDLAVEHAREAGYVLQDVSAARPTR